MDTWRKSSYSGSTGGACVEVASNDGVMIRDTAQHDGAMLTVTADVWQSFLSTLR
jgi:hypothetical protein